MKQLKGDGISLSKEMEEKVLLFEALFPQIDSLHFTMKEFASKKPDSIVSKLKLRNIIKLLNDARYILKDENCFDYLDEVKEEDEPFQNSDIVFIVDQYRTALAKFRSNYRYLDGILGDFVWHDNIAK